MTVKSLIRTILIYTLLFAGIAQAAVLQVGQDQRQGLALTIYNDDLVMINDLYRLSIPAGENVLDFTAIGPLMIPSSAVLHELPQGTHISHQYYQPAMTPNEMLRGSVGQTVSLARTHPGSGEQITEQARILAAGEGLILEIDGRYETDLDGRRIIFDQLPPGVLQPTLSIAVSSDTLQEAQAVLSYLSNGVSWQADYVAQLNKDQEKMTLIGMATIVNNSGMAFEQGRIELVAGRVNQASAGMPRAAMMLETAAMAQADAMPRVSTGDLQLYTVPGQHTLSDGSTRQLGLFSVDAVPVEKRYRLNGSADIYYSALPGEQSLQADSFIEFVNKQDQQLGMPLPAGTVRVYAPAGDNVTGLKFVGSDRIGHTPELARVSVKTGRAFDISAVRKQLGFKRLPVEQPYRQHSEVELQTVVRNARDEAVTVEVVETFGGDWQLVKGPSPDERNALGAAWKVEVPARGEVELLLTVRVRR